MTRKYEYEEEFIFDKNSKDYLSEESCFSFKTPVNEKGKKVKADLEHIRERALDLVKNTGSKNKSKQILIQIIEED